MGQIANQMVLELLLKLKQRTKDKKAEKKQYQAKRNNNVKDKNDSDF